MKILIDNRSGQDLPLSKMEELAVFVLDSEKMPESTELSISLVDIDEITTLNALYRGCESATDVLSFEMDLPCDGDVSLVDDRANAEAFLIGDVVINPDKARENIPIDEVSFEEELWILLIHGILHLIGYDHEDNGDRERMEQKEDELFVEWIRRAEGQETRHISSGCGLSGTDAERNGF